MNKLGRSCGGSGWREEEAANFRAGFILFLFWLWKWKGFVFNGFNTSLNLLWNLCFLFKWQITENVHAVNRRVNGYHWLFWPCPKDTLQLPIQIKKSVFGVHAVNLRFRVSLRQCKTELPWESSGKIEK